MTISSSPDETLILCFTIAILLGYSVDLLGFVCQTRFFELSPSLLETPSPTDRRDRLAHPSLGQMQGTTACGSFSAGPSMVRSRQFGSTCTCGARSPITLLEEQALFAFLASSSFHHTACSQYLYCNQKGVFLKAFVRSSSSILHCSINSACKDKLLESYLTGVRYAAQVPKFAFSR